MPEWMRDKQLRRYLLILALFLLVAPFFRVSVDTLGGWLRALT
jgi:preprotein translocase subunit SecE